MDSNYSTVARQSLLRVLKQMFSDAEFRVEPAAGGFIVGVIDPSVPSGSMEQEAIRDLLFRVDRANAQISSPADRVVIFACHFFKAAGDVFATRATLRSRADSWENGMVVAHTTSVDAYVLADALEAEALLTDPESRTTCHIVPDPEFLETGSLLNIAKYVQIDIEGTSFRVSKVVLDGTSTSTWIVHLTAD